jgi:hypothetical protein
MGLTDRPFYKKSWYFDTPQTIAFYTNMGLGGAKTGTRTWSFFKIQTRTGHRVPFFVKAEAKPKQFFFFFLKNWNRRCSTVLEESL